MALHAKWVSSLAKVRLLHNLASVQAENHSVHHNATLMTAVIIIIIIEECDFPIMQQLAAFNANKQMKCAGAV